MIEIAEKRIKVLERMISRKLKTILFSTIIITIALISLIIFVKNVSEENSNLPPSPPEYQEEELIPPEIPITEEEITPPIPPSPE